jgi:hypothetical protein
MVTLTTPPEEVSFSADFINAQFQCADHLQVEGTKSVNRIFIFGSTANPNTYNIEYGSTTILMSSKDNPDNSGTEFPNGTDGGAVTAEAALPYFKLNPVLNSDFDIQAGPGEILLFIAKKKGLGFDFKTYNVTPGVNEKLQANYTVYVKLMVQNIDDPAYSEVYSANLNLISGTNDATAILGDKLHQRLTADINKLGPEIPVANALMCNVSCRKFFFQYGESYGQPASVKSLNNSAVYTVIHGGLSYQAKGRKSAVSILQPGLPEADRFLKQGPKFQTVLPDQPSYLYFFNSRPDKNIKLKVFKYLFDGTNKETTPYSVAIKQNGKYCFDVSPAMIGGSDVRRYELWLENDAGEQISEKQHYTIEQSYLPYPRFFLNWSSMGSLDCRLFTGKGTSTLELTSQKASRYLNKGYDVSKGATVVFDTKATLTFKVNTGFKTALEISYNTDFFLSDIKYRSISGQLLPIAVTSGKIDLFEDGKNLFAQEFEYQYLFQDDAYSESDVFDRKPGLPDPPPFLRNFTTIYAGTPASPSLKIIQQKF